MKNSAKILTSLLIATLPNLVFANDTHTQDHYEENLIQAIDTLSQQGLDPALQRIEKLVAKNPNFKLAQLVYADLLLAKAQPLNAFGSHPKATAKLLDGLRSEAKQRIAHFVMPPNKTSIPASIVKLSDKTKYVIVVELDRSRLYVFKNQQGIPKLVKDFYVSIGKKGADKFIEGDKKTPIGVYKVTRFIADKKLPDFYGTGAFPINYPNRWDYRLGKTGHGIWLHGTPIDTYSRPPLASDGCVALSNEDFTLLRSFVDAGTSPVIITRKISWLERGEWNTQQAQLEGLTQDWRQDWESLDRRRYLSHYSESKFRSGRKNFKHWSDNKNKINARKSFIKINLSDVNIFRYPGIDNMLEFSFQQDYRSSNYSNVSNKRLYWQKNNQQQWRIVYEGPA